MVSNDGQHIRDDGALSAVYISLKTTSLLRSTTTSFSWPTSTSLLTRVDLEDFEGRKGFALYSSFSVDPEADGYKLHVSGFTDGGAGDSLSGHNGYKFSTFDKDQDTYENNCAKLYLGAFWYAACYNTNPNGVYLWGEDPIINAIGNVWYSWKSNYAIGMKFISMKIRRVL
ncbi:microfibril-associated glycoprotein 4-like [Sinocyclocheilus grahami]|uniref:microfibril-associated glycoprotein 4-like n=1 Tax=Sinocyclocheilus grahami TaxID=75366 RepID=UPI0007ACC992|nr:PREDICTED: microfibril-associated glycoprotein 4-like [Sinocyclocheilus grahami]